MNVFLMCLASSFKMTICIGQEGDEKNAKSANRLMQNKLTQV